MDSTQSLALLQFQLTCSRGSQRAIVEAFRQLEALHRVLAQRYLRQAAKRFARKSL